LIFVEAHVQDVMQAVEADHAGVEILVCHRGGSIVMMGLGNRVRSERAGNG
jgi:hypothetical protein